MKIKNIFLLLISAVCFSGRAFAAAETLRLDLKKTPPHLLQGTTPDFSKAKLVVVDFWASWCTPCLAAIPFYEELQKKYRDQGVVFISFSADDTKDDARKFLKKVSFSFPAYWDEGKKVVSQMKLEALPVLLFLNPEGEVLAVEKGYTEKKKKDLPGKIETWLKKAKQPRSL